MILYLASRSERRRLLLEDAGFSVTVVEPECEEPTPSPPPQEYVRTVARMKALSVLQRVIALGGGFVLGADTVVEVDGELLGKPLDTEDARRILTRCAGKKHTVYTGVYITDTADGRSADGVASARLRMRQLTSADIDHIIEEGRSLGRAGAYAIREDGRDEFVELLEGDIDTVVGLPIRLVRRLIERIGAAEGCSQE